MSNRPKRACRAHGCNARTRSQTRRCHHHRRPLSVHLAPNGQINIGGHLSLSTPAAIDLVDRIVDAIEAGPGGVPLDPPPPPPRVRAEILADSSDIPGSGVGDAQA